MNKILLSLAIIAVVAAIGIGATVAYFTDTETSAGNIISAGKLDLLIDSTCHYNGMVCEQDVWVQDGTPSETSMLGKPCSCTWMKKTLDGDIFFNYNDVKPGDEGENTISIHIDDNPAWVCASIANLISKENGCANNAELNDDATCASDVDGDLMSKLLFTVWRDSDCNNILDGQETAVVTDQPASELNWAVADSQTGGQPIDPEVGACLGVKWRVPTTVENEIQGDSIQGDIIFTAIQSRNNLSYVCGQPNNPPVDGVCGTANKTYASADESYGEDTFCSVGVSSPESPAFPAQGSSTNWTCDGAYGGASAQCSASRERASVGGACGDENGGNYYILPEHSLCSVGIASEVSGTGPWTWTCTEDTAVQCSANKKIDGACGTAATNYAYDANGFSGDMCASGSVIGSPSFPAQGGSTTWTCSGQNDGNPSGTCTATRASAPINGVCGSANGSNYDNKPSHNLCTVGTASSVSGSGPWNWTCSGSNGGTTASCSANKQIDGNCGNATDYKNYVGHTLCDYGTATTPTFSSNRWNWSCIGVNQGSTVSCHGKNN